ncbi:phosphatase domain-containing protein [Actinacidiphila soli]|uniref:phosphatase domain-containing protein n=1 Tax=Actinacidiphila soli TaxID=2487275 RepID=UPI0019D2F708|nr:hypothetical protein [Actinacidiphila soli]
MARRIQGNFISEQPQWAQAVLDGADLSGLDPELTYLAEAIYPENRIVVDHGQRKELVLLAAYRPADGTEESLSVAPRSGYNVRVSLDDKDRLIALWRLIGLPTWQANYANF